MSEAKRLHVIIVASIGGAMSKKIAELPTDVITGEGWAVLLEEMKEEYWASEELAEEEKRFLDELANLPEEEWEPIACTGKPVSETVIEERR
jgi:hypothetical protein